jgi:thiamine transport system permease protein
MLGLVQFGLCLCAALLAWNLTAVNALGVGLDRVVQRWDGGRVIDAVVISLASAFLLVPLAMVVLRGLPGLVELPVDIWRAALRSIMVAIVSAALCISLALALALRGGWTSSVVGVLPLAASSLVVGTGLFLLVYPFVSPAKIALIVTAWVNAVLALPFALRAIVPAVDKITADYARLGLMLNMSRWVWVSRIMVPRLRRPVGFAAGLAAALSMGDLGVITLFAGDAQETLPLAMYRLMGAYRMDAAAGAALLLLILSFGLFWLCDRGGRDDVSL